MFGQITEAEAARRGLIDQNAFVHTEQDGRLLVRNHRAELEWYPLNQLPHTPQPIGWRSGVNDQ